MAQTAPPGQVRLRTSRQDWIAGTLFERLVCRHMGDNRTRGLDLKPIEPRLAKRRSRGRLRHFTVSGGGRSGPDNSSTGDR